MRALLVFIVLSGIKISMTDHLKRNLDPLASQSEDLNNRQFIKSNLPKYRFSSYANKRHYRQIRPSYGDSRQYKRFIHHPHMQWYSGNLRNSNPSFQHRFLYFRDANNPNLFKYRPRNIAGKRSDLLKSEVYRSSMDPHNLRSYRKSNGGGMSEMHESGLKVTDQKREMGGSLRTKTIGTRNHLSPRVSEGVSTSDAFNNQSSEPEEMSPVKRDLAKSKFSDGLSAKRLYQYLGRFDLLYLLGLFLIFIPIASITVVILPVATFCWNTCKRRKGSGDAQSNLNDVTVETAFANDTPKNTKLATESKSFKDLYSNFVSNEFNNGEGDTVAKRMKIERWMTQDFQHKPKPRPRHTRIINAGDMESVAEEPSEAEGSLDNSSQYEITPSDSGGMLNETRDDIPNLSERPKKSVKASKRASKQESHPFNIPDKTITVGRVDNTKYVNPRHIYSLVDHSRRFPRRTSYSMVDVNPRRFSRL